MLRAMGGPRYEDARVHLEVFGGCHAVDVEVRVDACPPGAILPAARVLAARIGERAAERARAAGRAVSCREGCSACCSHLVPISAIEARALADVVAAMPPERRERVRARFDDAVRRMEGSGLLDRAAPRGRSALVSAAAPGKTWDDVSRRYFEARIPCPLVEEDRCSVYEDRPLVCREYAVTTPSSWCDRLSGDVEALERPVRLSEALAEAGHAVAGVTRASIPLALALEWAEVHGARLDAPRDGEATFWALMRAIEEADEAAGEPSP